jgi:hypothetical protein
VISALFTFFLLLQGAPQRTTFVPPGAVEGQLQTADGAPAIAVRVVAIKVPGGNGTADDPLQYFDLDPPVSQTQTDNDGHYSMMDIPPGRYFILAGDSGQGEYYPGVSDMWKATRVTVTSNEIVEDLSFKFTIKYGGRISGRVAADMAALGARTATITGPPLQDLVEVPVRPDGSFQFPQLPPSDHYLLSLYPPTSGISSVKVKVGATDVTGEELVPLPTQAVTGRLVTKKGPIPYGMYLGFETPKNYAGATINPDGTFSVQLHAATHRVDMGGLPVGYSIASIMVGGKDASAGIKVGNKDVTDVVITLNTPAKMAAVRGRITGLAASRYASTSVTMTGPIIGALQASVRPDGTFEFPVVIPGLYNLKLNPSPPNFRTALVTVEGSDNVDVAVSVPNP